MPAPIVFVHDDEAFLAAAVSALQAEGYTTAAFADPLAALNALEAANQIELLITGIQFPAGRSNGVALARMARHRRPGTRVIFIAPPDMHSFADGLGSFLTSPVDIPELLTAAREALAATPPAEEKL